MPYPYKKMDENDFEAIRRFTDDSRVWVGDEIAREYYHDEMPNYGTYPPELYVEVLNKEEVSAILAYAYEKKYTRCLPGSRHWSGGRRQL